MSLADQKCVPIKKGTPPLAAGRAAALLKEVGGDWTLDGNGHLVCTFEFPDFAKALAFADEVGAIADAEDHHPELHVSWGKCKVEIWTHTVGGLSESDFILAAKAERAFREPKVVGP
jgi:4a-hydroxytetrahydrobiopterin dehydratase